MILGDEDLKYVIQEGKLTINPLTDKSIRENGVDLTIDSEIAVEKEMWGNVDSHNENDITERFRIIKSTKDLSGEYFIIKPQSFNLLSTKEYVTFPDNLMGFCALRFSIARSGFISPMTIVDAGFSGNLTIEVVYSGCRPFKLYVGDRFLHLIVAKTLSPVKNTYKGVYKGQKGVRIPKCID